MPHSTAPTETLLRRFAEGDGIARGELFARFAAELRELAGAHCQRGRGDGLLQPTVLVNELWLRLAEREGLDFANRRAFLGFASRVMRNALVDEARAAIARGTDRTHAISLSDTPAKNDDRSVELIDLDEALNELEAQDAEAARLIELRFFAGLELDDIAETLGLSPTTVDRRWRFARAWLRKRLSR